MVRRYAGQFPGFEFVQASAVYAAFVKQRASFASVQRQPNLPFEPRVRFECPRNMRIGLFGVNPDAFATTFTNQLKRNICL